MSRTDPTIRNFLQDLRQHLPGSRIKAGDLDCAGQLAVECFEYSRAGSGIWRVRARRPRQDNAFVLELSVLASELEAVVEIVLAYLDRGPLPTDLIEWESPPDGRCFYAWSQAAVDRYANPKKYTQANLNTPAADPRGLSGSHGRGDGYPSRSCGPSRGSHASSSSK